MTLETAIEDLKQSKRWYESHNAAEQVEAHQLGIKAMEFGKGYFGATNFLYLIEHPGETEED